MADVTINHCTLRVVRRDGWNWGAEPKALVEAAMHALPELLARQLSLMWPDDAELEIDTPLRLDFRVRIDELLAAHFEVNRAGETPGAGLLGQGFESALKATLHRANLAPFEIPAANAPIIESLEDEGDSLERPRWANSLWRVLLAWREQDVLGARLSFFKNSSLEAWHRNLLRVDERSLHDSPKVAAVEIERLIQSLSSKLAHATLDRPALLRHRLIALVEVIAQLKLSPTDSSVQEAVASAFPLTPSPVDSLAQPSPQAPPPVYAPAQLLLARSAPPGDMLRVEPSLSSDAGLSNSNSSDASDELATPESSGQELSSAAALKPESLPLHVRRAGRKLSGALTDGETHICSALPFLLLGPLSRIGYLETLAATLEAIELGGDVALFALALAYKVLDPPERGWRRSPSTIAAAAAFAGLQEPPAESALTTFTEHLSGHLSPLDAVLSGSLIEGHTPGQPLLLHQASFAHGTGLLLLDVEGLFPIAWANDLNELVPTLRRFGNAVLLITQDAAGVELLRQLDDEDFRFITDGPPARGESWRLLRRPSSKGQWWTNDRATPESTLMRSARRLAPSKESAVQLWQVFDGERPSVPLSRDAALDKHLTLAATLSLGTIAWTLWRETEATAPQLAQACFRNLDARVSFERDSVLVRLPLGRRYRDLAEHGFLKDVRMIPWLGERVVRFAGG